MCLGKRFYEIEKAHLDNKFVNQTRRQFEEIKLAVLDACEQNSLPPLFEDAEWVYDLYIRSRKYEFLWVEFRDWLRLNKLDYNFQYRSLPGDDSTHDLLIVPDKNIDFSKIEAPELDWKVFQLSEYLKPISE